MELLEKLTQTPGVAGREERIREVVKKEMEGFCDEVRSDALGNLIGLKKGSGKGKIMIAGHMDEIGFLVKYIDDKGFIRLQPVGGFDPRTLMGRRVVVHGKKDFIGNLTPSTKPIHILTEEEKKKQLQIKDFFVDIGLPADKVKENVEIGDPVSLRQEYVQIGGNFSSKAMDDRAGVYVMLEAAKKLSNQPADIYLVATTQEEVGLRGAVTSAFGITPDIGIALDVTLAADFPGGEEPEYVTKLGEGVAIKIMDSASISDHSLVEELKEIAREEKIPHQMEILPRGGTDASGIQKTKAGIPVATLSVPCRYVHTVNEMVNKKDLEASINLLAAYLGRAEPAKQ
ncbi:MAG: M42 family metallopeptidase [Bacillota bacterium]